MNILYVLYPLISYKIDILNKINFYSFRLLIIAKLLILWFIALNSLLTVFGKFVICSDNLDKVILFLDLGVLPLFLGLDLNLIFSTVTCLTIIFCINISINYLVFSSFVLTHFVFINIVFTDLYLKYLY